MKIILSTDFSEENKDLFPYAIDLIRVTGGTIILFHAYMDQILMGDSSFPGGLDSDTFFNRELLAEMENQAEVFMSQKKALLEAQLTANSIQNISIETMLKGGDPELELIQITEVEKPDLILMGTSGKGKKGFLEGSMAKSIMAKVQVPVLAVPIDYQWNPGSEVMYATNFGRYEAETIRHLFRLLEPYRPTVHVLHIVSEGGEAKAAKSMEQLQLLFEQEEARRQIRFEIIHAHSAREAMKIFCEQHHISLAAFIAHKRTWLDFIFKDKVGKDDFFHLGIPMLTFRTPD